MGGNYAIFRLPEAPIGPSTLQLSPRPVTSGTLELGSIVGGSFICRRARELSPGTDECVDEGQDAIGGCCCDVEDFVMAQLTGHSCGEVGDE